MSTPPKEAPPRLADGTDRLGRLLGTARDLPDEATTARRERVWKNLTQRPRRNPAIYALPVGVVAALAAVVVVLMRPPAPLTAGLVSGEVEARRGGEAWAAVSLGQALGAGESVRTGAHGRTFLRSFGGGVLLLEGSRAQLDKQTELRLEEGTVVAASRAVTAGAYRIEGTSFAVRVGADQTLEVFAHDSSVELRGPGVQLQVASGHAWSSRTGLTEATAPEPEYAAIRSFVGLVRADEVVLEVPGPAGAEITVDGFPVGQAPLKLLVSQGPHSVSGTPVEAKKGSPARVALPEPKPAANADAVAYDQATQLEREGHPDQALAIHDALARGNGSRAEASLYVAGRLRLLVLGDAKGALANFTEHQRRFPDGALAQEVALSAIEAQLHLEQLEPALAAMNAFVARYPGSERLNEVHFLQAQVHSQRGECALALPLFAGLLEDPKRADDALYLTAYCEQALNHPVAARKHLQQYLVRFPSGKHLSEARAALGKR